PRPFIETRVDHKPFYRDNPPLAWRNFLASLTPSSIDFLQASRADLGAARCRNYHLLDRRAFTAETRPAGNSSRSRHQRIARARRTHGGFGAPTSRRVCLSFVVFSGLALLQ